MIDSNFIKNNKINISNVSRETLKELDDYGKSIISKNKDINLISSSTEKSINTRHIIDSAQTIDFIDNIEIKYLYRPRIRCRTTWYSFSYFNETQKTTI